MKLATSCERLFKLDVMFRLSHPCVSIKCIEEEVGALYVKEGGGVHLEEQMANRWLNVRMCNSWQNISTAALASTGFISMRELLFMASGFFVMYSSNFPVGICRTSSALEMETLDVLEMKAESEPVILTCIR